VAARYGEKVVRTVCTRGQPHCVLSLEIESGEKERVVLRRVLDETRQMVPWAAMSRGLSDAQGELQVAVGWTVRLAVRRRPGNVRWQQPRSVDL